MRKINFIKYSILLLTLIEINFGYSQSKIKDCNENIAFKNTYFENIKNVENLIYKEQNESFHNSLKFISQYSHVSYESMANYSRTYPGGIFENDKKLWIKWYEENKCNNIQFKKAYIQIVNFEDIEIYGILEGTWQVEKVMLDGENNELTKTFSTNRLKFHNDGTFFETPKTEKSAKGTWKYDRQKKIIELIENENVIGVIKSIENGKMVYAPKTDSKSPGNYEMHLNKLK
ncbi:hypothetical protein GON26_07440 [Flavobacterium sp. GA093]|uniref:Lipocalin-like domain-containing protein n=1 Tax=Flavobacterium hydrocarbonoxydans TaxID=2683249 RepID=A0A6I4NJ37_9FLAO|nr:lipocalin family protein [Flavobacterium hydrocarbonoxydans]MWB94191.1 hypothetical protein [Flavobacterium hydrocarbonoxydans]